MGRIQNCLVAVALRIVSILLRSLDRGVDFEIYAGWFDVMSACSGGLLIGVQETGRHVKYMAYCWTNTEKHV